MLLRALKYYFSERSRNTDNSDERDTTPDKNVCWEPYTGKWYEWARYETPFEYGLDDVYAVYESINEHELKITNYGTDKNGVQQKAHARAMRDGAGRLRVSFVPLLRFLSTPYHVLYVDDSYSHALVSDENGACLWLLGREPHYTRDALKELYREAESRGFDTSLLRLTTHH